MRSLGVTFWRMLWSAAAILLWIGSEICRRAQFRISRSTFVARPDDIFIATFPKSGTTLMQMMVYQLKSGGRMDFSHINQVCPFMEVEFINNRGRSLEALESPRCLKTHLVAEALPLETGRYIYILRDVRDVVVSAYHHKRLVDGIEQTLEEFSESVLQAGHGGRQVILGTETSWFHHLESWWPHRNRPNVLFLTYEEIVADLEGTARKVAAFCGITVREEDMPRIVEHCSLAFMKQHEDKFDPRFLSVHAVRQGFIREGKTGAGRELSERQKQKFEQKIEALVQKLGSDSGALPREIRGGLDKAA